ncbi:MAG: hypothetical protein LBF22_00930 [Deltaproteobacteria bacterium]|jgi:hypothetical protein|nr:hypothetical protein [Deltaproteobacteria bacterium]
MDFAAFLEPGLYLVNHLDKGEEKPWGQLFLRPNRQASWLSYKYHHGDEQIFLTFQIPGHSLLEDGSLSPHPGAKAKVEILALVSTCRRLSSEDNFFVLRFKSLERLI